MIHSDPSGFVPAQYRGKDVEPKDVFPPEFCTRCEQWSNEGCWHGWSPWWNPFAASEEEES